LLCFGNAANPYSANVFKETQVAGRTLGIAVQSLEVCGPDDFDGAFEAAQRERPNALMAVIETIANHAVLEVPRRGI
jgi:hypothetical protein